MYVLIRLLGFILLLYAAIWFSHMVLVFCLLFFGILVPILDPLWKNYIPGFISVPIFLVIGIMILKCSRQLTKFITKGFDDHF